MSQSTKPATEQSTAETQKQTSHSNPNRFVLPSLNGVPADSSKDPLNRLEAIAKDSSIEPEVKQWLLNHAVTRFQNRRRMAYLALYTIIAIVVFLGVAAVHDGVSECVSQQTCQGILASIEQVQSLMAWVVGFLASIIAAYYGVSSFRPSS